jgi:hypothetical protein
MHKTIINTQVDKILALALLVVVLSGAYTFARFVYFEGLVSFNHEIELRKRKNAKIDSILTNEEQIRANIKEQKGIISANRAFLNGQKSATAVSELQNYVKQLIRDHSNAKIQAIKPYPAVRHKNYTEASLEVRVKNIGHKDLHKVLYMFESKSPILLVKELDIRYSRKNYSKIIETGEELKSLVVTIVVSGFFRDTLGEG